MVFLEYKIQLMKYSSKLLEEDFVSCSPYTITKKNKVWRCWYSNEPWVTLKGGEFLN
jgi:hypothetical protein